MFNDLNSPQNNHQQIDDIFAETDKQNGAPANGSGIETHRVGLTTDNNTTPLTPTDEPKAAKPLWLKIVPLVIIASIIILSGYLVYSKYFSSNSTAVVEKTPVKTTSSENSAANTNANINANGTVVPSSAVSTTTDSNSTYVSEIPGLASTTSSGTVASSTVVSTLDSDSDGLTDEEEKIYGTNPLAIDTDNDGLSDYEEVKIYHTNPLLSDTDGDGHPDGVEVKNGYNPNGPGKMPGVASSTTVAQ